MIGLPNPYVMLAALGAAIGAFFYGSHVGHTAEKAKYATTQLLIAQAADASQKAAATEIAKIQIHNTTIQGKLETITRENTVYRDCHNSIDAVRLLNDALSGQPRPETAGNSIVSDAQPPG